MSGLIKSLMSRRGCRPLPDLLVRQASLVPHAVQVEQRLLAGEKRHQDNMRGTSAERHCLQHKDEMLHQYKWADGPGTAEAAEANNNSAEHVGAERSVTVNMSESSEHLTLNVR
jgi:hypothetical protein